MYEHSDRVRVEPATGLEPCDLCLGMRNAISPVEACRSIGYERASSGAPGVVRGLPADRHP